MSIPHAFWFITVAKLEKTIVISNIWTALDLRLIENKFIDEGETFFLSDGTRLCSQAVQPWDTLYILETSHLMHNTGDTKRFKGFDREGVRGADP